MDPAAARQRILVVAPNWIGDALMALPLIAAIKQASPASSVCVIAPATVARVLRRSSLIDETIETIWPHGGLQLKGRLAMALSLRQQKFSAAVILPNSFKSALVPLLARIPQRVGYIGEARNLILTASLPNPAKRSPMAQQYLALSKLLMAELGSPAIASPRLAIEPAEVNAVYQRFGLDRSRRTVVFCPGAEYGPAKRWPARHFGRLGELITATYPGTQLVVAGAAGDVDTATAIAAAFGASIISTAGKTSVDDAIALLAGADLVVSNDSGLMHVAAALDRPLVALYGSTDPEHTPPESLKARIMWLRVECSPCFQRVCPLGHTKCLVEMTPESVYAAIPPGTLN